MAVIAMCLTVGCETPVGGRDRIYESITVHTLQPLRILRVRIAKEFLLKDDLLDDHGAPSGYIIIRGDRTGLREDTKNS